MNDNQAKMPAEIQVPIQQIIDNVQEQDYSSSDFMNLIFGLISNKMAKLVVDIDRLNHQHKRIREQLEQELRINEVLEILNKEVFTQPVSSQGLFKST